MSKVLTSIQELYMPKAPGERKFFRSHIIQKHLDKDATTDVVNATGSLIKGQPANGDDVYKGAIVKTYDRAAHRHGYSPETDEEEYENFAQPEPNDDEFEEYITRVVGQPVFTAEETVDEGYSYGDDPWHPASVKHDGKTYFSTGKRGTRVESKKPAAEYAHEKSGHRIWVDMDGNHHGEMKGDENIGKTKPTWQEKKPAAKKKTQKESVEIQERTLTKSEDQKKEDLVHSMKKSAGSFKERYGKDWKSVMHATATKMAKEETEHDLAEAIVHVSSPHSGKMTLHGFHAGEGQLGGQVYAGAVRYHKTGGTGAKFHTWVTHGDKLIAAHQTDDLATHQKAIQHARTSSHFWSSAEPHKNFDLLHHSFDKHTITSREHD